MSDQSRLEVITSILKGNKIHNQFDLKRHLVNMGIDTTQSSISRDLKKLGVVKVNGHYKPPRIAPGESQIIDSLDAMAAGDNLIILKTGPGNAGRAGVVIDSAKIQGILGSIAGDDTIFLAVSSKKDHARILKKIFSLFAPHHH